MSTPFVSDQASGDFNYYLNGESEIARLLITQDWSNSALGPRAEWPEALQYALGMCLGSPYPIALYWGPEYLLLYNDAYISIAAHRHPACFGKPRGEIWPESWAEVRPQFEAVLFRGKGTRIFDKQFPIKRFGRLEECYFDYNLSPVVDRSGKIRGVMNAIIETTYRVINERRNKLLYRFSFESNIFHSQAQGYQESLDLLNIFDSDIPFSILYFQDPDNGTYVLTQATGVSKETALSLTLPLATVRQSGTPLLIGELAKTWTTVYPKDWPDPIDQVMILPVRQGENQVSGLLVCGIHPGIAMDASYKLFLEAVAGHISHSIANGSNYETEKKHQLRIRDSEDQFQFAIDAAGLGTWDLNPATNRFVGNERLKSWFGLSSSEEIELSRATDIIDIEDRARVIAAIQEAMTYRSGGAYFAEYKISTPADKTPRIVRAKGKALFNENEQVIRFSGTLQDITEERQFSAALEETNSRLQIALEAARLGSYDLDLKTREMYCTPQFKLNFGWPPDRDFAYDDLISLVRPEYRPYVDQQIRQAIEHDTVYHAEYEISWPDGSLHWISASGKPRYDKDGRAQRIIGVTSDITDQITARTALENAFEQMKLSQNAAQLGSFDMDVPAGRLEWDERCCRLFGIFSSRDIDFERDFVANLHPDDRDKVLNEVKKALVRTVSNGDYDVEYRTVGAEDHKLRWVKAKGKVMFNDKDEPLRFTGAVLDITDQKQDELRKNDFISMVSHELKTPLTSLKAYVQILNNRARKSGDHFASESLNKVEQQVNKMTGMINSFLNVARLESGKIQLDKSTFELPAMLAEVVDEAKPIMGTHTILLEAGEPVTLFADQNKIVQVMMNLVSNAVKYSPRGKVVRIAWTKQDGDAVISVQDEGMGIKPDDINLLFKRFYRVESPHTRNISGFGIGLYLSAEIVQRHGGNIWVESEKGVGSTFFFSLPLPG
ncbi:hypothetical protein C7T94_11140 [Pedobacter yulinensis]|uniref:histidine kinase n=1 Tax=Pedobacter yulinensis TaxID=2126353 RepID=A0A2T3HL55_9SPHI|nr:PAS domain-containing protein [Pedobacter yulinensis]PST83149.1 hypothetical protein C7T94_11140 [Pedobacter yulinensis]